MATSKLHGDIVTIVSTWYVIVDASKTYDASSMTGDDVSKKKKYGVVLIPVKIHPKILAHSSKQFPFLDGGLQY